MRMRTQLLIILAFLLLFIIIDNNCRCNIINTFTQVSDTKPKLKLNTDPAKLFQRLMTAYNTSGNGIMISVYIKDQNNQNDQPTLNRNAHIINKDHNILPRIFPCNRGSTGCVADKITVGYVWDPDDNASNIKCTFSENPFPDYRMNKDNTIYDNCGKYVKDDIAPIVSPPGPCIAKQPCFEPTMCDENASCISEMLKEKPDLDHYNGVVLTRLESADPPKPILYSNINQFDLPSALVIIIDSNLYNSKSRIFNDTVKNSKKIQMLIDTFYGHPPPIYDTQVLIIIMDYGNLKEIKATFLYSLIPLSELKHYIKTGY